MPPNIVCSAWLKKNSYLGFTIVKLKALLILFAKSKLLNDFIVTLSV